MYADARRLGSVTGSPLAPPLPGSPVSPLLGSLQHPTTQGRQTRTAEAHRLAVDVVVAAAPRGEGEATMAVGAFRQQAEDRGAGRGTEEGGC